MLNGISHALDVTCDYDREMGTPKNPGKRACVIFQIPVTDLGHQENYNFLVDYAQSGDIERVDFRPTNEVRPTVEFIPSQIFTAFPNLTQYKMNTNLKELHSGDFANAKNLKKLNLNLNQLTKIKNDVFSSPARLTQSVEDAEYPLHKLSLLTLERNKIAEIEPNSFYGLNELVWLSLHINRLTTIGQKTFAGLPKLQGIDLTLNEIETIEDGAFDLPSLLLINVSFNKLKRLSDDTFAKTPKLVSIEIGANELNHIGQSLYNLPEVRSIIMEKNKIEDIDMAQFAKLPKLLMLGLKESGFTFTNTKIEDGQEYNSTLRELHIPLNDLSDVTELKKLRIFPNLMKLNLFGNPYPNVEIDGNQTLTDILPKLREINLRHTAIECSNMESIIQKLKIEVRHDCH